jgi:autotransporter-associated beta strand protein
MKQPTSVHPSIRAHVSIDRRLLAGAFAVLLAAGPSSAQRVWNGSVSENWSDLDNWSGSGALLATDNVRLTNGVPYQAINQDIASLTINNLQMHYAGTLDVTNQPIALHRVEVIAGAGRVLNLYNDTVVRSTGDWTISTTLNLYGRVDPASSVTARLGVSGGGTINVRGSNTLQTGLNAQQGNINVYSNALSLGAPPATLVTDFWKSNFGDVRFYGPAAQPYDLDTTATRGISGGFTLANMPYGRLLVNAPVSTADFRHGAVGFTDCGDCWVNVSNAIRGKLTANFGIVFMNHTNAVSTPATRLTNPAWGTAVVDFNGNDFLNRNISWNNNSGHNYACGVVRNTSTNRATTIDGDLSQLGTGSGADNFGGRGEIVLTGNIATSDAGEALVRVGSGILRLKGTTTTPTTKTTRISGGSLILDYADNTSPKLPVQTLRLQGADLSVLPNPSSDVTVALAKLLLQDEGFCEVTVTSGASTKADLSLAAVEFQSNSTLNLNAVNGGGGVPVLGIVTNALLDARVTLNRTDFGRGNGTVFVPVSYLTADSDAALSASTIADYVDVTGSFATAAGRSAKALRFASPQTLTLGGQLSIPGTNPGRGAILVTPGAGPVTITGSQIDIGLNCRLHIFQYDANNALTIASQIGGGSGSGEAFTKMGAGELILTALNSNFQNNPYISEGTVTVPQMANNGVNGPLGTGSEVLLGRGARLKYTGGGDLHNRYIRLRGPAALEAAGSGLWDFTATGNAVTTGYGNDHELTLTGSGSGRIGSGLLALTLGGVVKDGSGTWTLGTALAPLTQLYRGRTSVLGGTLELFGSVLFDLEVGANGTLAGNPTVRRDLKTRGKVRLDLDAGQKLTVGLRADLGGELEIVGTMAGESVEIITAGTSVTGTFDHVPEAYEVTYTANSVVLSAAPPSGMVILVR